MDGKLGISYLFRQGVPQGAVLSPLLFPFAIYGVVRAVREQVPRVSISLYADDVAVWCSAKKVPEATSVAVDVWSYAAKLRLNAAKCEVSFFSLDSHEAKLEIEMNLGTIDSGSIHTRFFWA